MIEHELIEEDMKKILVIFIWLTVIVVAKAQKPPITKAVFNQWISVEKPAISNDGSYVLYYINNLPAGSKTLVVKPSNGSWEIHFIGVKQAKFAEQGRFLFFIKPGDTLCMFSLEKHSSEDIPFVSNYKILGGENNFLIYQTKKPQSSLVIRNLQTEKNQSFLNTVLAPIGEKVDAALLETKEDGLLSLKWFDLITAKTYDFWKGAIAKDFVFDDSCTRVAFIGSKNDKINKHTSIFYYTLGDSSCEELPEAVSNEIDSNQAVYHLFCFSHNSSKLFFSLTDKIASEQKDTVGANVNIWNYKDSKLQSLQLQANELFLEQSNISLYSVNISDKSVIQLGARKEQLISNINHPGNDYYLLLESNGSGDLGSEWNWSSAALVDLNLISASKVYRRTLGKNLLSQTASSYALSPDARYIIHFDPQKAVYMSYDIEDGHDINISKGLHTIWTTYHRDDEPLASYELVGELGWLQNDQGFLVSDQNDIYLLDPSGKLAPINLTNGYGKRQAIVFHLAMEHPHPFKLGEKVVLEGFSRRTKEDGFFSIIIGKPSDPEKLTFGPYIYRGSNEMESENVDRRFDPIKARNAEAYVVRRMSVEESPNYFITKDFKTFAPLSDVHPEKNYNWLTSELVTWKMPDGTIDQGILYKPENFDSHKKYPVILHYYERLSDGLHGYLKPEYNGANFNIPYYVSNGYLVFVPDIHYKIGHPGKSAFNCINSAADNLASKPWVDSKRMGIEGHSFGGFETDYVVTHTGRFAAACSASGWANFVEAYNSIRGGGESRQYYYEMFRERMGGTLWDKPTLYIENSPIFRAKEVVTPLLMMNNNEDHDIEFAWGEELFVALRRLQKKVWMLEYEGQGHVLLDGKAQQDYNLRTKQFFDHYLMGAAAPKWMIEGIPAYKKGIDNGYELEPGERS